jgi:Mrp family chromosome partitioning ATPase
MSAVSQDDPSNRPRPDAAHPRQEARPLRAKAPKPAPEDVRIPRQMLEVCRSASLQIGGPNIRRLGVTSALRDEGRTSIALAMAVVQREDYGRRVALVDMDLENPALARRAGLDPWPGLAEVARREATIDEVLQQLSDGVLVVPSGVLAASAARTMTDIVKADVLSELERKVDVVIADMPPLLGGGPGSAAARTFREILLVIRAGVTPVARIKEATDDLQVAPHVLLNDIHTSLPRWLRRISGR